MKRIVFFHIPKTAGSSFNRMLRENYGDALYSCDLNGSHHAGRERFQAMPEEERLRFHCITGHLMPEFLAHVPKPYTLLTFLRHPVSRVVSLYNYFMTVDQSPLRDSLRASGVGLRDYVTSGPEDETRNGMVRRLTGTLYRPTSLSGDELLRRAKDTLRKYFRFVGLQENFDASCRAVQKLCGLTKVVSCTVNPSRGRKPSDLKPATVQAIRRANVLDMELYLYGLKLHGRHMHALGLGEFAIPA